MKRRRKHVFRQRLTYGFAIAAVIILTGFLINYLLNPSNKTPVDNTPELKAAIVDQLSIFQDNRTFWLTAQTILNSGGFEVYYTAAVTVDFYRTLATQGFDLIIFRVHSAIKEQSDVLVFFTSEPFDDFKAGMSYLPDFLNDPPKLVKARVYEGADPYFGITPQFVKDMNGGFDNSVIIMMGCDGLTYTSMAEAFIEKGAKVYISWDGPVTSSHTDQATIQLLQHLIIEKQTVRNAVTQTNNEVNSDPIYKSELSWYPSEIGNYAIADVIKNYMGNMRACSLKSLYFNTIIRTQNAYIVSVSSKNERGKF